MTTRLIHTYTTSGHRGTLRTTDIMTTKRRTLWSNTLAPQRTCADREIADHNSSHDATQFTDRSSTLPCPPSTVVMWAYVEGGPYMYGEALSVVVLLASFASAAELRDSGCFTLDSSS